MRMHLVNICKAFRTGCSEYSINVALIIFWKYSACWHKDSVDVILFLVRCYQSGKTHWKTWMKRFYLLKIWKWNIANLVKERTFVFTELNNKYHWSSKARELNAGRPGSLWTGLNLKRLFISTNLSRDMIKATWWLSADSSVSSDYSLCGLSYSFDFSKPQFLHLQNWDNNCTWFSEFGD